METQAEFRIGDRVVYPMHDIARIEALCLQMIDGQPQGYYRLVLEGKNKGEVLVPVVSAKARGLRRILQASQVPEVLQHLQKPASQPLHRGQAMAHYAWCKARLRQGGTFGLAEVRRFLHDLEQVETLLAPKLQQLRDYVDKQLLAEIAIALRCTHAVARHLLTTALTSDRPVVLPSLAKR